MIWGLKMVVVVVVVLVQSLMEKVKGTVVVVSVVEMVVVVVIVTEIVVVFVDLPKPDLQAQHSDSNTAGDNCTSGRVYRTLSGKNETWL